MSFPGGIVVKNLPANTGNTGDTGSVLGYGRSFGGEIGTHSSILAWKTPWTEVPGRLQNMTEHTHRYAMGRGMQ